MRRSSLHALRHFGLRPAPMLSFLVAILLSLGCHEEGTGGDLPDAGDSGVLPDVIVPRDARVDATPPDALLLPDARPDAAPNPFVIELPPSGYTDVDTFTNAGFVAAYSDKRGMEAPNVYYYDVLARQEVQVTDREGFQFAADTDGNEIMFDDYQFVDVQAGNLQSEIFSYDIRTAEETRLTYEVSKKFAARFNDSYILYKTSHGCAQTDIFNLTLMDRSTGEATAVAECGLGAETHSMSEHYAAWTQRPYPGHNKDIFVRDLAYGYTFRIDSTDQGDQYFPTTDSERVLWQDHRSGWREIYMHTFATGVEEILTPDQWEQARPHLRDGIVAWCDYRFSQEWGEYGDCDVYVYEIATGVGRRVTSESAHYQPRFVDSGWLLYGKKIPVASYKLYMHDLVGDGILSPDGHVIPE